MTNAEAIEILKSKMDGSVDTSYEWAETVRMAIEALRTVQEHEETFEWCRDCREYDQEGHCCHRWTKCIRNTIAEWKKENGIVQCKDCVFYVERDGDYECNCEWIYEEVKGDPWTDNVFAPNEYFWCKYGERREDGKE